MMDQTQAGQEPGKQGLRGLKALVAVLGVLIIAGTAVVIGTVIKRLYAKVDVQSMSVAVPAAIPGGGTALPVAGAGPVRLPAGEHVAGIAGAGGVFALWVSGPDGDQVLLLDPQTGGLREALAAGK